MYRPPLLRSNRARIPSKRDAYSLRSARITSSSMMPRLLDVQPYQNRAYAQPSFDASAASPPTRDASPSGVAAATVELLKRHRCSTYGFSESVSIMSANEIRRGIGLPAGGVP